MKKLVSILSIFTMVATTGIVAVACTRAEIQEKPTEKKIDPEKETKKIAEEQETQFQNIKKNVGPKIEKLISKLGEIEVEKSTKILESEEGKVLDNIFQFYKKSKSFESIKEAIEKLSEEYPSEKNLKKFFLEYAKSTFDNYEKYKSKIDKLIDKYLGS